MQVVAGIVFVLLMSKRPASPTSDPPPPTPGEIWRNLLESYLQLWRSTPLARLWQRVADRWGLPRILLGLAMLAWFLFFAIYAYRQHDRFASFAFDTGIFDQSIWLLSEGEGFNTVRGLETFGHHGNVGFFLLVPFYWLGAGIHFLNFLQIAAIVLGAIPVFILVRDAVESEWMALVPALAFMTHFAFQHMVHEEFHPEILAVTPFLAAYLYARRKRWVVYGLWMALAVSWKEDIALAAAVFGLILVARGERRAGLWTMGAAIGWFVVVTQVMIPAFNDQGTFYAQFFGDLGNTPREVVWTGITHPTEVIVRLDRADALGYVRDLSLPYGFVSYLSPTALLIGLPQAIVNLLNIFGTSWDPRLHYAAMPLVGLTIAMTEAFGRFRRPGSRRFFTGLVAAFSLATVIGFGITPFSNHFRDGGYWQLALTENHRQDLLEQAVSLPDDDAVITATYGIVPRLTHRREIYMWPNPWEASFWAVAGENMRDPDHIEWLVLDRTVVGDPDLLDRILAEDEWRIHIDQDALLVAERIRG